MDRSRCNVPLPCLKCAAYTCAATARCAGRQTLGVLDAVCASAPSKSARVRSARAQHDANATLLRQGKTLRRCPHMKIGLDDRIGSCPTADQQHRAACILGSGAGWRAQNGSAATAHKAPRAVKTMVLPGGLGRTGYRGSGLHGAKLRWRHAEVRHDVFDIKGSKNGRDQIDIRQARAAAQCRSEPFCFARQAHITCSSSRDVVRAGAVSRGVTAFVGKRQLFMFCSYVLLAPHPSAKWRTIGFRWCRIGRSSWSCKRPEARLEHPRYPHQRLCARSMVCTAGRQSVRQAAADHQQISSTAA
jgi:hypothetical protein